MDDARMKTADKRANDNTREGRMKRRQQQIDILEDATTAEDLSYGPGIDDSVYHTIEELETEATFSSSSRSLSCPEGIITAGGLCTGVAYDNFDLEDLEDNVFEDITEEIIEKEIPDHNGNYKQNDTGESSNNKTEKKETTKV
ncbi:hypothetical protein PV327_004099 [Microctonus hyperodae]|uniref:Uncharacterized protein n=1 Tax=Microctonus hyperodae TaxID=165561 RepID=A0AA39FBZ5_MICHY|nr:hypothetical protein PV327_004099 [Microctonus hyperodae]